MKRTLLSFIFLAVFAVSKADFILIPMDATQANHLKAYGVAFQALKAENTVQWLLNYRGGAFLLAENDANEALLKNTGVVFERLSDNNTEGIINTVLTGSNTMNLVTMNHMPKIAVYAPPYDRHYDDAVMLALNYAGIDYTTIYEREVMSQDLGQYDWIHMDHEDFTGQYNKWQSMYNDVPWFKSEMAYSEASAREFGFAKVSQLKAAVAKKLKAFVENGGQLFAMCAGTETMDIALAADGVDIVGMADGDPADTGANSKLNFNNTLAFQNFKVTLNPYAIDYSNIGTRYAAVPKTGTFTLAAIDAKQDLTGAMLVQNHVSNVRVFMGNTAAFTLDVIKPSVSVLGSSATYVKYLHGQVGKGYFTFYAGHDPECYMHRVGDPATNLDLYKQSAGYRLILNNVLSPAVTDNALGVSNLTSVNVNVYPNPFVSSFTVNIASEEAKQATISVYNLTGQVMFTDNVNSTSGTFSKQYSTDNFAAGLYIVEVSNSKGTLSKTVLSKAQQ